MTRVVLYISSLINYSAVKNIKYRVTMSLVVAISIIYLLILPLIVYSDTLQEGFRDSDTIYCNTNQFTYINIG